MRINITIQGYQRVTSATLLKMAFFMAFSKIFKAPIAPAHIGATSIVSSFLLSLLQTS